LATTGAHVTDIVESSAVDGIDEGGAEHFAATKWPMTQIDTVLVCSHAGSIAWVVLLLRVIRVPSLLLQYVNGSECGCS
jgi:hypothetical protein